MSRPVAPYFSQWESRELTPAVIAEGAAALLRDPNWAGSGARSIEEYAEWAVHLCGMACLKMILAAKTGRAVPILELARKCTEYGGYTINAEGEIKGLIYAPFVEFIRREYGIEASVVTELPTEGIAGIMSDAAFFIASVHHSVRWPDQTPPFKGGHLVLVLRADRNGIVFHNPSGHDAAAQENVMLPVAAFDKFFANRGIAIRV